MNDNEDVRRTAPWFAIVSGILGICSFISLIAYITTPALQIQDSGVAPHLGQLVLNAQFLCSSVQTLMMIPVAIWLYRVAGRQPSGLNGTGLLWTIVGVGAFGSVGLLRLVAMTKSAVSHPFHAAAGLCRLVARSGQLEVPPNAVWLDEDRGRRRGIRSGWRRTELPLNGGLAVFSKGPFAYGNDVNFHSGLGLFGFPGLTLFATWSILLGLRLRRPKRS